MSGDLTAFVTARLDEDEAAAKRNIGAAPGSSNGLGDTEEGGPNWPDYQTFDGDEITAANHYLDRFRPLRMLREVDAKRAILARHHPDSTPPAWCTECSCEGAFAMGDCLGTVDWPCPTILDVAAIYSDHPAYRPEWAPEGESDGT